jgi:hypothetical protein
MQTTKFDPMGIRSFLSHPLAAIVGKQQQKWSLNPAQYQNSIRESIVKKASHTIFGKDHHFSDINSYEDFKHAVPVNDYEGLSSYVNQILEGHSDVLWPDKPLYFAKTSGTTSGTKYIPVTKDSISNHINSARNALLSYINDTGQSKFIDGKLIFLSGSPVLETKAEINTGRLSGIVNHHVPSYLRGNQLPTYETNCIEDWEQKVDKVVDETLGQDMRLISGIPPWVQMYFDRLIEKEQKKIKDIFPNFSLFVYGGVNFEPYKNKLYESIGKKIDSIELYPASEGFIAYQDTQSADGMLLLTNTGIFYEFIPADEYFDEHPTRLSIEDVKVGVNYALVINSNAGLWGYSIGDTVKFLSLFPHRLIVSGRIKHFISAFGEHVIGEEVEKAMRNTCEKFKEVELIEFTVAPQVTPIEGLPHHEWMVSFARPPQDKKAFIDELDNQLRNLNSYYDDLISGAILKELEITMLEKDAFIKYMKSIGKLGGQNKVPRLSNDRKIADELKHYAL